MNKYVVNNAYLMNVTIEVGEMKETSQLLVWKRRKNTYEKIPKEYLHVIVEIYRRLRKLPEYERPVALLSQGSIYGISKKYDSDMEETEEIIEELKKTGILFEIDKGGLFIVYSLNPAIFIPNYKYYAECGTMVEYVEEYSRDYCNLGEGNYENVDKGDE